MLDRLRVSLRCRIWRRRLLERRISGIGANRPWTVREQEEVGHPRFNRRRIREESRHPGSRSGKNWTPKIQQVSHDHDRAAIDCRSVAIFLLKKPRRWRDLISERGRVGSAERESSNLRVKRVGGIRRPLATRLSTAAQTSRP